MRTIETDRLAAWSPPSGLKETVTLTFAFPFFFSFFRVLPLASIRSFTVPRAGACLVFRFTFLSADPVNGSVCGCATF